MWSLRTMRVKKVTIRIIFMWCILVLVMMFLYIFKHCVPVSAHGRSVATTTVSTHAQYQTTAYTKGCRDNYSFPEVELFVELYATKEKSINSIYRLRSKETYSAFLKRLNLRKKSGKFLIDDTPTEPKNLQEKFERGVTQHYLYDPNDDILIRDLLRDISTKPVVSSVLGVGGTQLKIILTFSDGTRGRFKPMRLPRDAVTSEDKFSFSISERHTSEIAAFHLDRLLGFNRATPTVGRVLNMTRDLADFLANRSVVEFTYTSPAGNLCFIAKCRQQCGREYPFCGRQDFLEGSVAAEIPFSHGSHYYTHPYKVTYTIRNTIFHEAKWENNEKFCDKEVKNKTSMYRLLQFSDISIFDFLIGNFDRYDYVIFDKLGVDSFIPVYDSGRGFIQPFTDNMLCLALLRQCCLVRLSTLATLLKLYQGPDSLSHLMRESLSSDPLAPILTEPHLDALDRRVGKVIKAVSDCIKNGRTWQEVVIDDTFITNAV